MKYMASEFDRSKPSRPGFSAIAMPSDAAGDVAPFQRDREYELGEGKRQHEEGNAAGAHAEEADQRGTGGGDDDPGHEPEPGVHAEQRSQDRHRIGAQAEEGGMAERHQSGEAEQQVEAHGEDREDVDFGDQRARIVRDQEREDEHRQDHEQPGHARLPSSPACSRW